MRTLLSKTTVWVAAGMLLAVGCGDDDDPIGGPDSLFDTSDFPDGGTTEPDTSTTTPPDATGEPDATAATDTAAPDLIPDLAPPEIVSSTPDDGADDVALPLVVTITFDERLYAPTVSTTSVKLLGPDSDEIAINVNLNEAGTEVTITPVEAATITYATPYRVRLLANTVSDLAGNRWQENKEIGFTAENWPDQGDLRAVAERYAPVIHSLVDDARSPHAQIPTKLDSDGDWDLTDNVTWLRQEAESIIPAVYYNVAETHTHYFVHYMLYFPWVDRTDGGHYGNGASGYMVTVEKADDEAGTEERPVAVHSYFSAGAGSDINIGAVTTESGIAPSSASGWCAHGVLDQDALFPEGRFEAYVTSRTNQACLWSLDAGALAHCTLDDGVRARDQLRFGYGGGQPTPVTKAGGQWPSDMGQVDEIDRFEYALIPVLSTVWPRRYSAGPAGMLQQSTPMQYAPDEDRPGDGIALQTRFKEPLGLASTYYGRPLWGWGYDLASGSCDIGSPSAIRRGQMALDPAWYLFERHTKNSAANSLYDPAEDDRFLSVDYCFNALVGIDQRGVDPECGP